MTTGNEAELTELRRKIDEIDEKIIQQLTERTAIVKQVGKLKEKTSTAPCPIRAGREAEMVRGIIEKFRNTDFPPAAAAAIWRIIIGASTSLEAKLTVSVFATEQENNLYWMAREYFGAHVQIIRQPQINRVIGDVMDGKTLVGVIPFLRGADASNWWTTLLQKGENIPKIFAHIPFFHSEPQLKANQSALALAKLTPESSGNDMSLVVIETDANVSQHKLQTAFTSAKLDVNWISTTNLSPATRHHFIEIKGFIDAKHEEFAKTISELGKSVLNTLFLGAYAVPVNLTKI